MRMTSYINLHGAFSKGLCAEAAVRHESSVRGPAVLPGARERRGTFFPWIRPHPRHQPQERLWICGKSWNLRKQNG